MSRATVWVCFACGKRSNDEAGRDPINSEWDESCMFNSRLCYVDSVRLKGGRVSEVAEGGIVPGQSTETAEQALARISRSMNEQIERLRSGDVSDLDPEMLEYARQALEAKRLRENAQPPVQPHDPELNLEPKQ